MEEDDILYQSIIADPETVSSDVDISRLRTETPTDPRLLGGISEFPGLQFDPTQYSAYEDLYDLYSTGLPMIPTPATDTAQIPGAADILVDAGSQDQATGDLGLDTTFQDAGATDVPGTIGTLGSLTEPGVTQEQLDAQRDDTNQYLIDQGIGVVATDPNVVVAPGEIPLTQEEIDIANLGIDYRAQPTGPALDLSGTSEELIDQGVIETPQEFYERTYRTSTGESSAPEGIGPELTIDYDSLDQEEKNLIDQQYGTAYGLSPAVEPAPTIKDLPLPTIQLAVAAKDAYDRATAPSLSETIDFDTYADPGVDAEENQLTAGTNLQTTDTLDITEDPIAEPGTAGSFMQEATLEEDYTTPAEEIYSDQGDSGRDTDVQQSGTTSSGEGRDTDVQQSGTASDFSGYDSGGYDPAPSPVDDPTDRGGSGGSSGGGGACVIATHAVDSGAFTPETKREAVRWCIKNLHRTWWGEAVRRGYRYYGQKAIDEGKAKNHYQEFKDYVAFGTGRKRTLKTAWTFVYRTIQFFIKGITIKNAKR